MARQARIKVHESDAWYHLYNRAADYHGCYPLQRGGARRKFRKLLKFYSGAYFCEVFSYCLMGNHFHLVVHFEKPRRVDQSELYRRALRLYPESQKELQLWEDAAWLRFRDRLFDVSEFMANVQVMFAKWFNRLHKRRGHFWAERFKSTLLLDSEAVRDCMIYVDLNPVRAGLVALADEWIFSSIGDRVRGLAEWLAPLASVAWLKDAKALDQYRAHLLYRGTLRSEFGRLELPREVVELECRWGFSEPGVFRKGHLLFRDGLVVGRIERISEWIRSLVGPALRGRKPRPVKYGERRIASLRGQRSSPS